jgi:hypothetical protein
MKRLSLLILSLALVFATGCTEENPATGGWDVGNGDTGADAGQDSGSSDTGQDTTDDTVDPDTGDDVGEPDVGTDAGACGVADNMCEWDCAEQDPDCRQCPDKSEFTGGPWDTETCAVIDYGCPEGSKHYYDEVCGCGCVPDDSDPCAAQNARGQGACAAVVGVVWNGQECQTISGCSCAGSDCDEIYDSLEACKRDRSACFEPDCAAQDARGVGPCEAVLGWAWTGKNGGCQALSGCECEGSDCQNLFGSERACKQAYVQCDSDVRCGGFGGIECPDGMYCDYPQNSCGATDGTGVCKEQPRACPEYIDEVCGCDGQVYTNPCFAHASGTDIYDDLDACNR